MINLKSVDDLLRVSVMLAKSGYFNDSKEAAQAGVRVLAGLEMGFGPVASMSGIHIIKGKPTIGANLMAAAVKRSGKYNYSVIQHTDAICTIDFYENNETIGQSSFTLEDAKKAGVAGGDSWRKFPRNMLFSRAISNGVRWYCPDVLIGVYTPEEMGAETETDEEGNAVTKITPIFIPEIEAEEEPDANNIVASSKPTFDRNLLNSEIESYIKRKNISIESARELLHELFKVRGRSQLDEKQLSQFLDYLRESIAA